jgi:hypothetical protein
MKIKPGFILRQVAGQSVVVAVGPAAANFNGMIYLNPTGALLWQQLEQGSTREQLVESMLVRYTVDRSSARLDVDSFMATIIQAGFVEP